MDNLFPDFSHSPKEEPKKNVEIPNEPPMSSIDEEFNSLMQHAAEEYTDHDETSNYEEAFDSPMHFEEDKPSYNLDPNFLDGMNPEQKEAVLYDEGSLLVLAGAGSGKTRVITHRFAHLIQKYELRIHNILCVTFTNKAAGEMKERIGNLLGVSTRTAWVRTFHSMCAVMLREHATKIGFSSDFTIYDTVDTKNAIKKIMERLKIDNAEHPDKKIMRKISTCKEELIYPEDLEKSVRSDFDQVCADVYKEYQQVLKSNNAMDFGDLIGNTIDLLERCPEVRERYQRQWRFIMADEFQDTNKPQYHLLSLLSRDYSNVCVVGDDDQSIYAWRGAKVENIHQFQKEFNAHIIRLERNYRSYGNILTAANSVVKSIKGRMPKTLKAERDTGEKIIFRVLDDDRHQAAFVYEEIRKQISQGKSYKDFAILYRTNAQSRVIEEVMTRHNIPHRIYGGQRFFDRAEIKDILSYLRVVVNPQDAEAFDRIVNVPKRKIGDAGKQRIQSYVNENVVSYSEACLNAENIDGLSKQAKDNLINLGKIVTELKDSMSTIAPTEIVKILLDSIRYFEDYLVAEYGTHDAETRFDNIQELVNAITVFEKENPNSTIADFLREASLLSSINEEEVDTDNVVSLMTIHSSKGLEFPIVFVVGVAEGVLPLRVDTVEEENEEKRLLYVAITRAMNKLYISYEEQTMRYGNFVYNEKSHFLDSIPEEILDKQEDTMAKHTKELGDRWKSSKSKTHISSRASNEQKFPKRKSVPEVLGNDELKSLKTEKVSSIEELQEGTKVIHQVFGQGVIEYSSEAMVKVRFDRFGTQVLMGSTILNLKKVIEE